ncbi:MAG: hypothetical protein ACK5QH_08925 [Rubrivivax sp.]|jgi:hypothetical protein
MSTATKSRYYAPIRTAEAEVSLEDFSDDEILEYVRQKNLGDADIRQAIGDLNTLDTLLLCGLRQEALELISQHLSEALGRHISL